MRRFGGLNVSSKVNKQDHDRGRSQSPKGMRDWRTNPDGGSTSGRDLGRFVSPTAAQDAAILQSVWGDDVKIRQGKALLKPSEIRNRTPGKRRQKDWGECPLTFDVIQHPVRAGDGKVYERWAIEKWLKENGNRSPLTNVVIDPKLIPLADSDEGTVKGERFVSSPKDEVGINTALNVARSRPDANTTTGSDEDGFTDIPEPPAGLQVVSSPEVNGAAAHSDDDSWRNREIANILRDTSIPQAQKQARIQAIRAGQVPPPQAAAQEEGRRAPMAVLKSGPELQAEPPPARSVSSPSAPKLVWPQQDGAAAAAAAAGSGAAGGHANGHKPPRKSQSEANMDVGGPPKMARGESLDSKALDGSMVAELVGQKQQAGGAGGGGGAKGGYGLPPSPSQAAGATRDGMQTWRSTGQAPVGEQPKAAPSQQLLRSNTFSEFEQAERVGGAAAEKASYVGIGVTFGQVPPDRPHGGALYVKRLQEGGPTAQTGKVLGGDILFEVDGVNVYRTSVQTIQAKILGRPGSLVSVVFKRSRQRHAGTAATPGGTPIPDEPLANLETVKLSLQRVSPQPSASAGQQPKEILFDEAGGGGGARGGGKGVYSAQGKGAALQGGPLGQTLEVEARKAAVALFGRECVAWKEMLAEGEAVDLSFVCADQRVVRAHRLLLAGSSPMMRRVLKGPLGQVTTALHVQSSPGQTQVTLMECRGWAVDRLVQFLYGGKLRVSGAAELAELFSVSRHLDVAALQEAAEDGLLELLTVETCCDLLMIAEESGCSRVLEGCRRLVLEQYGGVSRSGSWVNLAENEVELVLKNERLVAVDEEQVLSGAMRWMSHGMKDRLANGRAALRGERLAMHIRFATMSTHQLQQLQQDPLIARSQRIRAMVEQGLSVHRAGTAAQPRQGLRNPAGARAAVGPAMQQQQQQQQQQHAGAVARAGGAVSFAFDPARSHANHLIRESGTLAVLREEGDSEHSALLSPAIPRAGRHFVEFLIENSGTPECYIQLGVCSGTHDVANGTPAYQSDTGWCFSCHNGNLLHYDQGSEYCSKLPRQGDRVGLLVDMDRRTLEVFVNSEGQGVMVRNLPETLHFVVDGGDKGQAIRIINAASPVRS